MVEYIADYYQGVESLPVRAKVEPGYLKVQQQLQTHLLTYHDAKKVRINKAFAKEWGFARTQQLEHERENCYGMISSEGGGSTAVETSFFRLPSTAVPFLWNVSSLSAVALVPRSFHQRPLCRILAPS